MSKRPSNASHAEFTACVQDLDKDDYIPEPFEKGTPAEVFELVTEEKEKTRQLEDRRLKRLRDMGFEVEHSGEAIL